MKILFGILLFFSAILADVPDRRVVAEWEPALGTMIRWPLGIPPALVVELATDDIVYVLVENNNQENSARNSFIDWGIDLSSIEFIYTQTYSHWTRDHGPQFIIGDGYWRVVNQQFNGYPVENGCEYEEQECDESMILFDCVGTEFCNNQPGYQEEGYDCYIANDLCEDFNGDGQIMDWIGDGYCDDGEWGLDFMCDEYSWDCGDCGGAISDDNGYCDDGLIAGNRNQVEGRPLPPGSRGWEEDDDTNVDFANQLNWDIQDLPLYWTGGNFMTDGYGMGFSTELMVNENNMNDDEFINIVEEYLNIDSYHIFDNPNEESIQHIDCLAKLVDSETIIIKQVPESSPEYDCMEDFADSFYKLNTFYGRAFNIHRIYCPEINAGQWEVNPVAAYTNSLILNDKVLVPQYGIPEDTQALNIYQEAMPGYDVIGFYAIGNPWYSEDALHCRTMGVFNPDMMHISHKSIRSDELYGGAIIATAEVVDYSTDDQSFQGSLNWKYSADDGPFTEVTLSCANDGLCFATFPQVVPGSEVEYYLSVNNSIGGSISHPSYGWHTFTATENALGDLNGDGVINILDVIIEVNAILDQDYVPGYDMNGDFVLNVQDIILLINLIIG